MFCFLTWVRIIFPINGHPSFDDFRGYSIGAILHIMLRNYAIMFGQFFLLDVFAICLEFLKTFAGVYRIEFIISCPIFADIDFPPPFLLIIHTWIAVGLIVISDFILFILKRAGFVEIIFFVTHGDGTIAILAKLSAFAYCAHWNRRIAADTVVDAGGIVICLEKAIWPADKLTVNATVLIGIRDSISTTQTALIQMVAAQTGAVVTDIPKSACPLAAGTGLLVTDELLFMATIPLGQSPVAAAAAGMAAVRRADSHAVIADFIEEDLLAAAHTAVFGDAQLAFILAAIALAQCLTAARACAAVTDGAVILAEVAFLQRLFTAKTNPILAVAPLGAKLVAACALFFRAVPMPKFSFIAIDDILETR